MADGAAGLRAGHGEWEKPTRGAVKLDYSGTARPFKHAMCYLYIGVTRNGDITLRPLTI